MKISMIGDRRHDLGESPLWSPAEQAFYWVDGLEPAIYRLGCEDRAIARIAAPAAIGSIALAAGGGLVAALDGGFHHVDETGWRRIALAPGMPPTTRFNDGKADRRGRFLAGGMDLAERDPLGCAFVLDRDGSVREIDRGYVVFNGPCWSLDDSTLFTSDSAARTIWRFDYDLASGRASGKTAFLRLGDADGLPDGATIDAAGTYWQARNGAGKLVRHALDGRVLAELAMPTANVTSLAFGGPQLDALLVTSMNRPLPGQSGLDGHAGRLFLVEGTGATGIAETPVAAA